MNDQIDTILHSKCRHADLLIHGGTVLTPNGAEIIDIACSAGRIIAMSDLAGSWTAETSIAATGLHILPGVIDSQVHFREPGQTHKETFETGTRSAVLGGVTAVFEMPNTQPLTIYQHDLEDKMRRADGRAWCDFAFYIGGSAANTQELDSLENLPGCAGIKVFMGSSFGDLLADEDTVLQQILRQGYRRIAIHAEDETRLRQRRIIAETSGDIRQHPIWRDELSALTATQRIVNMVATAGRRLHILHVSTAGELTFLVAHKHRVSVEALPHHLTLYAPECYDRLGTLAQMNPPIREQYHQNALWQAIRTGLVDVLGSDHAPHTMEEKKRPYPQSPSGMSGVQTLLPIMLNHVHHRRLNLHHLVDLTSSGPARIFGVEGKGRITLGYDADLTIVDLQARREISNRWIASLCGWTPYDGMHVTGWPIHTIVRGHVVVRDEVINDRRPKGKPIRFLESRNVT